MIERRTLSISLTPELHAFVSSMVQEGTYGNASEVVRAGLRLLRRDEGQQPAGAAQFPHSLKAPKGAKG